MISIVMRPWTQHKIISVIIWPERNYDIIESSGMFSPSAWLCSIPETQANKKCRMKRKSGRALNLYIKKNSLPSLCDDYNSITQISNANLCMPNSSCTALKLLTRGDEEIAKRPQKPVERMSWMLKLPHTNKSTWLENGIFQSFFHFSVPNNRLSVSSIYGIE